MTPMREFVILLIPFIIMVLAALIVIRYYVKTEKDKLIVKIGLKNKELITPVRLQAYERIVLLLERMEPSNIVLRNVTLGQNAAQLQQSLISNIKEEFDHNLSQQLYISSEAWALIREAHEAVIASVNEAASKVSADAPAADLAQIIFEKEATTKQSEIYRALEYIKNEARLLF
ncbi:MAG: hypothetical protein ACM3PX_11600 [Omnitrophica WOR_2 bacterium]|jgi:hypothetical protein